MRMPHVPEDIRAKLPQPTNGAETYLAALLDAVHATLARLPEPPAETAEGEAVELTEPAKPRTRKKAP